MTTGELRLTWRQVSSRRLERHGLAKPFGDPLDEAVSAMCGAHAQVMSAAEISIGLRQTHTTRTDVQNAITGEHSLVKTFGPRGTVHLLPARDLPTWVGALAAIPGSRNAMPADARMTDEQIEAVISAIGDALLGAELTADELGDAVVAATGPWAADPVMPAFGGWWPRWRQVIGTAAHRGVLIFGSPRNRTVTYTNPSSWFPGFVPAPPGVSSRELARRYLHAYGPATSVDFARWLAAPRQWAADVFAGLGNELAAARIDDEAKPSWVLARDIGLPDAEVPGLRLLPYFDAFTVGSHPRHLLFPAAAADRALAGGQAGNFPVLLVDGEVAGVWHLRRAGRRLHITVEPLLPLTARRRRELDEQVSRIGEIAEGIPSLTIGPVAVGPHA